MTRFDVRVEGLDEHRLGAWLEGRMALTGSALPLLIAVVALLVYVNGTSHGVQMAGDCQGTISARPLSGYDGDSMVFDINIRPPFNRVITGVQTDNPGCHDCAASRMRPGHFRWFGVVNSSAPGTWTVQFLAFDRNGAQRCSGSTPTLTGLGRRPK